jgi:hypothetical protein
MRQATTLVLVAACAIAGAACGSSSNQGLAGDGPSQQDAGSSEGPDGGGLDAGVGETGVACPADVICIGSLPYRQPNDTAGAPLSKFSSYSCAPTIDASGPEVLYRLDLSGEGLLALQLTNVAQGANVNVFLMSARDPGTGLIGGAVNEAAYLQPGEYWISVDTTQSGAGAGAYTLGLNLTSPADMHGYGMSSEVARSGLRAYSVAWKKGDTSRFEYGMTDFSLRSSIKREWIVDLSSGQLLWNLYVAHGSGSASASDQGYATVFSNTSGSYESSLGMVRVAETYEGTFGHSARLDGLEPGYNDNMRTRDIVLHPCTGAEASYVQQDGMVAVTEGCPAIDDTLAPTVANAMSGGALLWFWYPDGDWSKTSAFLQ